MKSQNYGGFNKLITMTTPIDWLEALFVLHSLYFPLEIQDVSWQFAAIPAASYHDDDPSGTRIPNKLFYKWPWSWCFIMVMEM